MQRPFCFLTISFAAGILSAGYFEMAPTWLVVTVVVLGLFVSTGAYFLRGRSSVPTIVWVSLLLAVFCAGWFHYIGFVSAVTDGSLSINEERQLPLLVEAVSHPETTSNGDRLRWEAKVLSVQDSDNRRDINYYTNRRIMVFSDEDTIISGGQYQIEGVFARPFAARNPHTFDYRNHLMNRGIGYVYFAEEVMEKATPPFWNIGLWRHRVFERMMKNLGPNLSPELAGTVAALTLGIRSELPHRIFEDFRRAGLGHLLAISGLHLAVFGMALLWVLSFVLPQKSVPYFAASGVLMYCQLVGGRPSVWRAAILFLVWLWSQKLGFKGDFLNSLAGAALLLLVSNPGMLFDVGFQLSFAACWGLACITPQLEQWISLMISERWTSGLIVKTAAASTGVYLATAPLILYHFNDCSLWALLVNPLLVPLMVPVMLSAWFCALVASAGGANLLLLVSSRPLALLLTLVQWLGSMSASLSASPVPRLFLFFYGSMWAVFPPPKLESIEPESAPVLGRKASSSKIFRAAGIWLITLLLVLFAPNSGAGLLRVVFFDVGQGDCILIEDPGGKTVMIDTGPFDWQGGSILQKEVAPYILSRGIAEIDYLILTHSHLDHIGGTSDLLQHVKVRNLWLGPQDLQDKNRVPSPSIWGDWLAEDDRIESISWSSREGSVMSGEFKMEVLWPPEDIDPGMDLNERSVAAKISYGSWSMLAMGDVEGLGERLLLHKEDSRLSSTVLKVGHHGGARSTQWSFLSRVRPVMAVVPVGRQNPYGMPCPNTIERLHTAGVKTLTTKEVGAVMLHTDGKQWWVETMFPLAGR